LFSKAASLCGDLAFPASGRQTFREIVFTCVRAFRRIFISLLTVRETDLLPFCAGLGSKYRGCHLGEIEKSQDKNNEKKVSHNRFSIDAHDSTMPIVFGSGQFTRHFQTFGLNKCASQ